MEILPSCDTVNERFGPKGPGTSLPPHHHALLHQWGGGGISLGGGFDFGPYLVDDQGVASIGGGGAS